MARLVFLPKLLPQGCRLFASGEWEVPEAQPPPAVATTETQPSVAHTISIYKFESLHSNSSCSLRIINNSICARTRNSSQVALHPIKPPPFNLEPSTQLTPLCCHIPHWVHYIFMQVKCESSYEGIINWIWPTTSLHKCISSWACYPWDTNVSKRKVCHQAGTSRDWIDSW